MLRTFRQHMIREHGSLDGWWDLTTDDRRTPGKPPSQFDRQMFVPGAWEKLPGLERHRGQVWLRRMMDLPDLSERAARIVFAGVSHTGTVFIDGKKCGWHYDAFTPFDVLVQGLKAGAHELALHVDNSFGDHSALHKPNDYFTYGGITRPVELQYVPPVYIQRIAATPTPASRGRWTLSVRLDLHNWSGTDQERRLQVEVAGQLVELGSLTIKARSEISVTARFPPLHVEAWTAESPRLYPLRTTLLDDTGPVDDLIERVGFREIKIRGKKLLLNGKPIRLRGYNRHEDHPQFGCAIPLQAMVTDLQIMQDLGCNFVRTSHYPNDQRFLDLCDEMGFYVWEESHARQVDLDHPRFVEQIDTSTREMIQWHHNHPSIIIWGILNECDSSVSRQVHHYQRLLAMIRELDPSRPHTFASDRRDQDLCFGLGDIVSVNRYIGWYQKNLDDVEPSLKQFLRWLNSDKSHGAKGKPVILSEFGGGAIPGYRQTHRPPWSEEYQADVLDEELRVYLNHPQVVGAAIWQFCDVRVTEEGVYCFQRPRTMNNKGTVDEFRRPKLAYEVVKKRLLDSKRQWDVAPDGHSGRRRR